MTEFVLEEKRYSGGPGGRIDLSALALGLLEAIRQGHEATLKIFHEDKVYIEQVYGSWLQPKFQLLESNLQTIFSHTDAKKCAASDKTPYQRIGPFL